MRSFAVLGLMAVASLVSQTAGAQPVRACPPGQAVQALDPGGKVATCIPVPTPVDLGAVNAAISAEAAARAAGDQNLNGRVDAEAVARMAADDALHETSIVGTYAFFGTRACVSNAASFDANGVALPPQTPFNNWSMSRGFYTFDAGGSGTGTADVLTISTGGASLTTVSGPIVWSIDNGKLTVSGEFTNATIHTENPAPQTGFLGKDLKVFSMGQEGLHVETLVQLRTINGVLTEVRTPRICNRQTTLTKMAD